MNEKIKTNLLTIIIPVHNRKIYFKDALESAITQSIKCSILVIDNAPTSNFFELTCSKYPTQVKYYKYIDEVNMFSNWNRGIHAAKSKFVMILGDDDILKPNFVETFIAALEKFPDINIFYSNFIPVAKDIHNVLPPLFKFDFGYLTGSQLALSVAKLGLGVPTISMIIKKELFQDLKYNQNFHASNDWLWFYSQLNKIKCYGSTIPLVYYRKHPESDTLKKETLLACTFSHALIYSIVRKTNKLSYITKAKLLVKEILTLKKLLNKDKIACLRKLIYQSKDELFMNYFKKTLNALYKE